MTTKPLRRMPRWYVVALLIVGTPTLVIAVVLWLFIIMLTMLQFTLITTLPDGLSFQLLAGAGSFLLVMGIDQWVRIKYAHEASE